MSIPLSFIFICIPIRIIFIVGAFYLERSNVVKLPFIVIAYAMSLGFLVSDINSEIVKKGQVIRGFAGGVKYWNSLAHSGFFALFASFLLLGGGNAYIILIVDLIFGIVTVIEHYIVKNNNKDDDNTIY